MGAKVPVSLATVYNTLHQFLDAGVLRQVAVDGSKTYFDTNVSQHQHFFIQGENAPLDIADCEVILGKTPVHIGSNRNIQVARSVWTHAPQQKEALFGHLIGAGEQRNWHLKAERLSELIAKSALPSYHHTQFIVAKVSTMLRLLKLIMPMFG
jgi:hypothetical protein